jgi:hypothetical protein
VKRRDPMPGFNRHVAEFAAAHRLRRETRDDGEVVLPLGPRRARPALLGVDRRPFPLDCHASFGLRRGLWTVFAGPTSTRRLAGVVAAWRSLGLAPTALDFEAWVDVGEDALLRVLDAHRLTRPRRRPALSEERRAELADQVARFRPRAPNKVGVSGPDSVRTPTGRRGSPPAVVPANATGEARS